MRSARRQRKVTTIQCRRKHLEGSPEHANHSCHTQLVERAPDRIRQMPKISEIEPTPNPNAMKFILKEPLTWGITRSYDNAALAADDPLAAALFDVEHVTNVFYVDH